MNLTPLSHAATKSSFKCIASLKRTLRRLPADVRIGLHCAVLALCLSSCAFRLNSPVVVDRPEGTFSFEKNHVSWLDDEGYHRATIEQFLKDHPGFTQPKPSADYAAN